MLGCHKTCWRRKAEFARKAKRIERREVFHWAKNVNILVYEFKFSKIVNSFQYLWEHRWKNQWNHSNAASNIKNKSLRKGSSTQRKPLVINTFIIVRELSLQSSQCFWDTATCPCVTLPAFLCWATCHSCRIFLSILLIGHFLILEGQTVAQRLLDLGAFDCKFLRVLSRLCHDFPNHYVRILWSIGL